jgi:hypothetical protein
MAQVKCPQEWSDWVEWLAAGLHGRNRWRLPVILSGMLFARGRRTVTSWLRAASAPGHFSGYYYFIAALGRNSRNFAERLFVLLLLKLPLPQRVLAVIDDTPTKRSGPHVQGADIHHHPTPGPADQPFLYGHLWVTLSLALRHELWGTIGLPLWALLYVRARTIERLPKTYHWEFRTKLQLGVKLVAWLAKLLHSTGRTLTVVADGAYAKRPFLRPLIAAGVTVISRLRKDAHLRDLPRPAKHRRRGRPRKYGKNRISLAKRGAHRQGWQQVECVVYGKQVTKTCKTFLASYRPAGGIIRVVIVKEQQCHQYFFATDPACTPQEIIEAFADRACIEQDFHDLKEVWGAAQQQVRNLWANLGAFHLNLWMHTLLELWAWHRPKRHICDRRDSPWDDPQRRPSHADRCKALRRLMLKHELSSITAIWQLPRKMLRLSRQLLNLAV